MNNRNLNSNTKIYIAGHNGLIGSSFIRRFNKEKYTNVITASRSELNLTHKKDVDKFFRIHQPEIVILAAGRVGGIIQNRDFPADFINENLSIQLNVFNAAHEYGVKRLIFFGSSCMYPRDTQQPMKEEQLWTGPPEKTSIAYASAKFAGVQMCQALNRQYRSVNYIPVIPNSIFGPNDNFELNSSHVLSALIRRFHEAKSKNSSSVILWGTGSPRREFIYVDDVVDACILLLKSHLDIDNLPINIGVGEDMSIKSLASKISRFIGYEGVIKWDETKPDGAPSKLLCNNKIKSIGWKPRMNFIDGLKVTYNWYLKKNNSLE